MHVSSFALTSWRYLILISDKADSWQKIHRQTGASEHTVNFNKPTWLCGDEKLNKLNNSKHIYSRETTNPPYLHGDEETASFNGGKSWKLSSLRIGSSADFDPRIYGS